MEKDLIIRQYKPEDNLGRLLIDEGHKDEYGYKMYETFVMENGSIAGFFTIKYEQELPSLQHFILDKKYRNIENARNLIKGFKGVCRLKGYKNAIISVPEGYLTSLVVYYFRKEPYANKDGMNHFVVKI